VGTCEESNFINFCFCPHSSDFVSSHIHPYFRGNGEQNQQLLRGLLIIHSSAYNLQHRLHTKITAYGTSQETAAVSSLPASVPVFQTLLVSLRFPLLDNAHFTVMMENTIVNPSLFPYQLQLQQLLMFLLEQEPPQYQDHLSQLTGDCRPGALQQPLLSSEILTLIDNNIQQAQHQPLSSGVLPILNYGSCNGALIRNGTFSPFAPLVPLISNEGRQQQHRSDVVNKPPEQQLAAPKQQLSEQATFLILVKSLLKILERQKDRSKDVDGYPTDRDQLNRMEHRVKRIVSIGSHRNRKGDKEFIPLHAALEPLLRQAVGDVYWDKAICVTHRYCAVKGWKAAKLSFQARGPGHKV
jgi:hypothetical protein